MAGKYVDTYVLPLPKSSVDAYRTLSEKMMKVWREHGAGECYEWIADDVSPGKVTSFPQAVQLKDDETLIIGWIIYESRAERDRIKAAAKCAGLTRSGFLASAAREKIEAAG